MTALRPAVLAFGTYNADQHPRIRTLLEGLSAHDFEVIEVNEPLHLSTAERVKLLGKPWLLPPIAGRLIARWSRLVFRGRSAVAKHRPVAIVVGYLGHFDVVLARLVFPRTTIVLDHLIFAADTAKDRGLSTGIKGRVLRLVDWAALKAADVIVLDTEEHRTLLPANLRVKAEVVKVGAPRNWFIESAPPQSDEFSIIFYGLFTPLQGTPVIARALQQLADQGVAFRATMVGTGQEFEECRRTLGECASVAWIEWVTPDALPTLVASHDVCLGIFGEGPKALRVVPNKVYQGAAAGCAIVTSDTAPQRAVLGDAALLVAPGNVAVLAEALAGLANDAEALRGLRLRSAGLARAAFTGAAITEALSARLGSAK